MKTKFAVGCALLCLAVVNATKGHLRGTDDTTPKRALQLFLGGGPIDPEDCPLTDPENVCDTTIMNTVSCRGCKYDNKCLASGAGFLIRRECQLNALLFNDPVGFSGAQNCPVVPPTGLCLDLIAPVTCGGCEYGNSCFAEKAGFDLASQCKQVATQPPVEDDFVNPALSKNCPTSNVSFLCLGVDSPVVCGPEACEYNSTCYASAAGFNTTSCEPPPFDQSQCELPSVSAISCDIGEPVECRQCLYDSYCIASAAGYSFLDCGPVLDPEPEPESDPEINTTIAESLPEPEPIQCNVGSCRNPLPAIIFSCGSILNPVICNGCCEYSNPCLAAGAGLNPQVDCQQRKAAPDSDTDSVKATALNSGTEQLPDLEPAECPSIRDDIPCTGSSKPVLCRGCEYFNRCFAAGAGFSGDTCLLKGAPVAATPTAAGPATAAPPPTSFPADQQITPAVVVVTNVDDQSTDDLALTSPPTIVEPASTDRPTSSPTEQQSTTAVVVVVVVVADVDDQPEDDLVPTLTSTTVEPASTDPPTSSLTEQQSTTAAPTPECPLVPTGKRCFSTLVNPVNCPGDCRYDTLCKAESAGFKKAQCPSIFSAKAPATTSAFGGSLGSFGGGATTGTSTSLLGQAKQAGQLKQAEAPAPESLGGFSVFP
jgi:hypothetical protein